MSQDRYKHKPIEDCLSDTPLERFKPLNGYVLVEREEVTYAGAIILIPKDPVKTRRECTFGHVRKIGERDRVGKRHIPVEFTVSVGDRVLIDRYAGHDLEIGGKVYVLCKEHDLHAKFGEGFANVDEHGDLTVSTPEKH